MSWLNVPAYVKETDETIVYDCAESEWFSQLECGMFSEAYEERIRNQIAILNSFPFYGSIETPEDPLTLEQLERFYGR